MSVLELARFAWKPNELRLLLVAMACGGPVSRARWVARTGIPRNHLMSVMLEAERLGGCTLEVSEDGVAVRIKPVSAWRVTPLIEKEVWEQCWRASVPARLDLVTEARTLADALSSVLSENSGNSGNSGKASLARISDNPACPDSGQTCPDFGQQRPDSGSGLPGFRAAPRASDRSVLIEKDICLSRVPDRDRGDRGWLLEKLQRMPGLRGEVMKPQGGQQERISRMFWELEKTDPEWLRGSIGDLADNSVVNKAAWFNTAATKRLGMLSKGMVTR